MTELLTAAQMRAIEQAAIDSGLVTGLELMERVGLGVVEAVFGEWPELGQGAHHAVVLCGPGNNGGDGFVVARLLAEAGWQLSVHLYGFAARLPEDAKRNFRRWSSLGPVHLLESHSDPYDWAHEAARVRGQVTIDALFGIGFTRPLVGPLAYLAGRLGEKRMYHRVVSIDIPSGLCADTGQILGFEGGVQEAADAWILGGLPCVVADLTVSFHRGKPGHFAHHGPSVCGKLLVKDIGL